MFATRNIPRMANDSHRGREAPAGPPAEASLNARLVGAKVSPSYASLLANGRRTPSLDLALDLEEALGIPVAAWRQGPEAVKVALAEADAARAGAPA